MLFSHLFISIYFKHAPKSGLPKVKIQVINYYRQLYDEEAKVTSFQNESVSEFVPTINYQLSLTCKKDYFISIPIFQYF